jgi:hypothetical protein
MHKGEIKALKLKKGQIIELPSNKGLVNDGAVTLAEVMSVVKSGDKIVVTVRIALSDGKFTLKELVFTAEETVVFVAGLIRSNFFGRLVNTLRNLISVFK